MKSRHIKTERKKDIEKEHTEGRTINNERKNDNQ